MAYNTSKAAKDRAAARDVKLKMKNEQFLITALFSGYFLPIARDLQSTYSELGIVPNLIDHNRRLNSVLTKHYENVQQQFDNQVHDSLGTPDNAEFIQEQIEIALEVQRDRDVHFSSQAIAQTTDKTMNRIVEGTIAAAIAADIVLSQNQIAKQARAQFLDDSRDRIGGIAMTQTQFASEGAKNTEMGTLDRVNAVFPKVRVDLSKDRIEKTWVAVLDARTRPSHAEADGQIVPFDEPYVVMDQKLRYPGDTSLGATLNNVINCRCSSVKSIHRET